MKSLIESTAIYNSTTHMDSVTGPTVTKRLKDGILLSLICPQS